jgi:Leucine-rich repeat (LRR) protein
MNNNKFIIIHNISVNLKTDIIENSDDFIKCILEKSNENLNLSDLGIINLNLNEYNNLLNKFIKIDLSKNIFKYIQFIPDHIVDLNVSFNQLKNINFIKNLVNLKFVDISYNNNVILQDNIFENLTNLKTLNMAGNNLKNVFDGLFERLEKLEYLNLAGNNLNTIKNLVFPEKLEFLNITYNNIQKEEHDELKNKLKHIVF